MEKSINTLIQDRSMAGLALGKMLSNFHNDNTVVVGIPNGGVVVAASIAKTLDMPLEIIPYRTITHPVDSKKILGSLTSNDTYIPNFHYDIPQDYLDRKIKMLSVEIENEKKFLYGDLVSTPLNNKGVILVDDLVQSPETILACLLYIKRENPNKIVIAVPVMTLQVARLLRSKIDNLYFLTLSSRINMGHDFYADYPEITVEEVREILHKAKCRSN